MVRVSWAVLAAAAMALSACGDLTRTDQGRLQPQTVDGPCTVKKFFLVRETAMHTNLSVGNSRDACQFSLINPDLQVFLTAALVTDQPLHGTATAGLLRSGTQATVSYVPQPGYTGPDHFTFTLEPGDAAVSVAVTVTPNTIPTKIND